MNGSARATLPVWGAKTYVMGILNVTPDSFSGDGLGALPVERVVAQAMRFVELGADILDVGGESTRPGAETVTGEMERARVVPAIAAIRSVLPDVLISIDSYRAETARAAIAAGADWINDVRGLQYDAEMVKVSAENQTPTVIMHNGRNRKREGIDDKTGGYYGYFHYNDLLPDLLSDLQTSVEIALNAGVKRENIILDPGIGFGKTGPQNLEILRRLDELKTLGYPLLLGTSRKGFIGHALGGLPAQERVEGTAATNALGIAKGADIIRVHDVKEMVRVARMTDAIVRMKEEG